MWNAIGRVAILAALLAIALVLSGVSIVDGELVVAPARVEAQSNWQCSPQISPAAEWIYSEGDPECGESPLVLEESTLEMEWDEVRDSLACDDSQTGNNGNPSFYIRVGVQTCGDVDPGTMALRAYEYDGGSLVGSWSSYVSQGGAYWIGSGTTCYDSCNWPTYWEVEVGSGSAIEWADWHAGCCTCFEYGDPCS